jgi:Tfp pilus assembly protein PilF
VAGFVIFMLFRVQKWVQLNEFLIIVRASTILSYLVRSFRIPSQRAKITPHKAKPTIAMKKKNALIHTLIVFQIICIFILICLQNSFGQTTQTRPVLYFINSDTSNYSDLPPISNESDLVDAINMAKHYTELDGKYSLKIASFTRKKSIELGQKELEGTSIAIIGASYFELGNYTLALKHLLIALSIHESTYNEKEIAIELNTIGQIYHHLENYDLSYSYYQQALGILHKAGPDNFITALSSNLASLYIDIHKIDSALIYAVKALNESILQKDTSELTSVNVTLGEIYLETNQPEIAYSYLKNSLNLLSNHDIGKKSDAYYYMAEYFMKKNYIDSALVYFKMSLRNSQTYSYKYGISNCFKSIATIYDYNKRYDSATIFYRNYIYLEDSIFSLKEKNKQEVETFKELNRQEKISQIEKDAKVEREETMEHNIILLGILLTLAVFVFWSQSTFPTIESIRRFGLALLLVIYEYVNLRLHALFSHYNHSEFYLLGCLVGTGFFLVQLHSRFEHYFENVILGILQRIRISKAKEKVVSLENEKILSESPPISNLEPTVNSHQSKPPIIKPEKKILKNTGPQKKPKKGKK